MTFWDLMGRPEVAMILSMWVAYRFVRPRPPAPEPNPFYLEAMRELDEEFPDF